MRGLEFYEVQLEMFIRYTKTKHGAGLKKNTTNKKRKGRGGLGLDVWSFNLNLSVKEER